MLRDGFQVKKPNSYNELYAEINKKKKDHATLNLFYDLIV